LKPVAHDASRPDQEHLMLVEDLHGWDMEVVYSVRTRKGAPDFQHYRRVEGRARSPGIRLGRGNSRSSLNLHPKQTTKWF